jgi:acetyltransferase-like isoleucine patch superfamily enzyme
MIGKLLLRWRLERLKRAGLQIGDECRILGWPTFGSEPYLISIGPRVGIASKVVFITHDGGTHVFRGMPGYEGVIKYGRITIHENSIIGYGVILLPGVEVGPNSVVAAGSVVTKSVPPNSLAMGVPARVFMTTDEYAKQSLATSPAYDREAYRRDKRAELLRIFPRPW